VLLEPGGSSRLLTTAPDLLLGLDPATARADHSLELPPGSTVLLYTDGLVERRGVSLDDGLAWLLAATAERPDLTPDQLCDVLLEAVADTAEDDIALLVMRAHPEDRPRPDTASRAAAQ
jgi:serine phosphatase RsbU (regulator of sigma subunit)